MNDKDWWADSGNYVGPIMNIKDWWADPENSIGEIANTPDYFIEVATRSHGGLWEYAIVRWRHNRPMLVALLQGGKVCYSIAD